MLFFVCVGFTTFIFMNLRKRAARPTMKQKEYIANFMANEVHLARNLFTAEEGQKKRELWTELTNTLNSLGGSTKSVDQWIKFWNDWKNAVQKKTIGELNALDHSEEAGPSHKEVKCLTATEQLVLNITSNYFVDGNRKSFEPGTAAENIAECLVPNYKKENEILEAGCNEFAPTDARRKRSLSENDMYLSKRMRRELETEKVAAKMLDLETKKVGILERMLGCFEKIQRSIANIEAELF